MAIPLGTENKRQVYIVIALFVIVLAGGIYELRDYFGGSSAPTTSAAPKPAAQAATARPTGAAKSASGVQNPQGADAQKLDNTDLDPTVHFETLAQSEDV